MTMRINSSITQHSLAIIFLGACHANGVNSVVNAPDYASLQLADKPNILWLVTEDMGPYIPPFGDYTVQTPNLSSLAEEGIIYPHLYSPSAVCAPSRFAIATGMYPSGSGANHMRTHSFTDQTGLKAYEAVPFHNVKMISELLRQQGYYCTNNIKQDYQFKAPDTAWDESSHYAHWRNRAEGQPFYAVFNFTETHESGLFEPYGFRSEETRHYQAGDTSYSWKAGRMPENETSVHISKDTDFPIPRYLPDNEVVRRDMWKMYNNIAEMDIQLGAVLNQLKEDGLLESTIIFFYSDHGGPLPKQKRMMYDTGLNSPMIIRFPEKQLAGKRDEQLISFVDFAPTLLSLAGVEPLKYMQGQAFMGKFQAEQQRKYIHAAADRFDEVTDAIRAVRDKRFKYLRNYRPEQGYYLPLGYLERIPTMKELLRLRDEGKLNDAQAQWFRETKKPEELYDCVDDPYELNNLVDDPAYKEKLNELQAEMDRWIAEIGDQPNLPEAQLIEQLWNGSEEQPKTDKPIIAHSGGKIRISCTTPGASIGYKLISEDGKTPKAWSIYQEPQSIPRGGVLTVKAHRIGYLASEEVRSDLNPRGLDAKQ